MMEVSNQPDKEFKTMVIKMLTGVERRVDELSKNFNKEMGEKKKTKPQSKNTITEMKNTLEGTNSRLADTE